MPVIPRVPAPPKAFEQIEPAIRVVIGGSGHAAVRRILLYLAVFLGVALPAPLWFTLIPLVLLFATDGLL